MTNWWSDTEASEFFSTLSLRYAHLKMDWQNMSLLRQIWQLPSLNGHSSACRGDQVLFLQLLEDCHSRLVILGDFSPYQAWHKRVQSSHNIWYFWAIFGRTPKNLHLGFSWGRGYNLLIIENILSLTLLSKTILFTRLKAAYWLLFLLVVSRV